MSWLRRSEQSSKVYCKEILTVLLEEFDRQPNAVIDPNMCAERIEDFPEVTIIRLDRRNNNVATS